MSPVRRPTPRWVELHLLHRRRWLLLCVVGTMVSGAVWVLFASPWLTLRTVRVEGTQTLAVEQVQHVTQHLVGQPLARVDREQVQRQVQAIPEVAAASVTRHWPHTLEVRVRERVAVARTGEPTPRLVDVQGVTWTAAQPWTPTQRGLPEISLTAPSLGQQSEQAAYRLGAQVAQQVQRGLPPALGVEVSQVQVRADQAVVVFTDGRQVLWGDSSNSQSKVEVLAVLWGQDAPTSTSPLVDVRDPTHPIAAPLAAR